MITVRSDSHVAVYKDLGCSLNLASKSDKCKLITSPHQGLPRRATFTECLLTGSTKKRKQ